MSTFDANDPVNRRGFFRGLTARLLDTVADQLERRRPTSDTREFLHLRPPGRSGKIGSRRCVSDAASA